MMTAELQEFIRRCRKIVEFSETDFGQNDDPFEWGRLVRRTPESYEDENIQITCDSESPQMEIVVRPPIHPHGQTNPVVVITENGEMIRDHGEWVYARVVVDRLYRGLFPSELN